MRARWLSTFSIIGLILIVLAIVGLVSGPSFVFDPGQSADGKDPWYYQPGYYIIVGILMLLNGLISPVPGANVQPSNPKNSPDRMRIQKKGTNSDVVTTSDPTAD